MQRKRHDIIIGLFVLTAILTTAFLIIKFGGFKSTGNFYEVTVLFNTAAALMQDAPVFYAGVECGSVQRILPVSSEQRKVRIVLRIRQDTIIRKQDTITISTVSLLGDKIIKITPGDPSQPIFSAKSVIEGEDPIDITDIFTQELQSNVNEVVRGLADLVNEENRILFSKTIKNLYLASVGLSDDLENLRQILNEDTRVSLKNIISDFEKASKSLPILMEQMTTFLNDNTEHVEDLITSLTKSSDNVTKFISSLQMLGRDISNPEGTFGKLIHSTELYDDISAIVEGIKLYGILGFQSNLYQKEIEKRKKEEIWEY